MSLITVVSQIFMNPLVANNMIIHIARDTAKGNTLNIDSVQFFLRKILYDLFGKLFSGSKSFKEQLEFFEEYREKIRGVLELKPDHANEVVSEPVQSGINSKLENMNEIRPAGPILHNTVNCNKSQKVVKPPSLSLQSPIPYQQVHESKSISIQEKPEKKQKRSRNKAKIVPGP